MNWLIVRQMKEFSDSLPASSARKYICVHAFKLSKLNEEENETATISNFLHLFTLHVAKKFSFNVLKTASLKMEKKTTIEAQSEGEVKATWPTD